MLPGTVVVDVIIITISSSIYRKETHLHSSSSSSLRRNSLPEVDPRRRLGVGVSRGGEEADLLHREGLLRADQREEEQRHGGNCGHRTHGAGTQTHTHTNIHSVCHVNCRFTADEKLYVLVKLPDFFRSLLAFVPQLQRIVDSDWLISWSVFIFIR